MTSAIRSVVDNPSYLSKANQLQITTGLSPKNVLSVFFQEMRFSREKGTLTFIFEALWKPPIYENLKNAFQEYIGSLQAEKLVAKTESSEVRSRIVITVNIPLQNGRSVIEAYFQDMKVYRNPDNTNSVEFTVSVFLDYPKIPSEEELVHGNLTHAAPMYADIEPIYSDIEPIYSDIEPIYSDIEPIHAEPIYQILDPNHIEPQSIPPEINWDTFPQRPTSKRNSLEFLVSRIRRFYPKCLVLKKP